MSGEPMDFTGSMGATGLTDPVITCQMPTPIKPTMVTTKK